MYCHTGSAAVPLWWPVQLVPLQNGLSGGGEGATPGGSHGQAETRALNVKLTHYVLMIMLCPAAFIRTLDTHSPPNRPEDPLHFGRLE